MFIESGEKFKQLMMMQKFCEKQKFLIISSVRFKTGFIKNIDMCFERGQTQLQIPGSETFLGCFHFEKISLRKQVKIKVPASGS